jgi:hypothetical protein
VELAAVFNAGTGPLSLVRGRPGATAVGADGTVTATFPRTRFQFMVVGAEGRAADTVRDRLKRLVGGPKPDDDPTASALFDFADRSGDGKVEAAEADAAASVLGPLLGCRAVLTFTDHGNGLFELFDRNGDGRLSPRELVEAASVVRPFADARERSARETWPGGSTWRWQWPQSRSPPRSGCGPIKTRRTSGHSRCGGARVVRQDGPQRRRRRVSAGVPGPDRGCSAISTATATA